MISFNSCKSSKRTKRNRNSTSHTTKRKVITSKRERSTSKTIELSKADKIINSARQFKGVKYKWGGTTKAGMDCSGLVFESFKSQNIYLPRISRDMAKKGHKIKLKETHKGDLLFFKTKNRRRAINHVGLVVEIKNNAIYFIHSTSSKGVIISSLNEDYWLKSFSEARRIL